MDVFNHDLSNIDVYCDLPLGLFIVRGDNIVVFGEIDNERESSMPLQSVSQEVLMEKMASGKKSDTEPKQSSNINNDIVQNKNKERERLQKLREEREEKERREKEENRRRFEELQEQRRKEEEERREIARLKREEKERELKEKMEEENNDDPRK